MAKAMAKKINLKVANLIVIRYSKISMWIVKNYTLYVFDSTSGIVDDNSREHVR